MKKPGAYFFVLAIAVLMLGSLVGCGVNLDREVTVQDMTFKVPSNWVETINRDNNDDQGYVSFIDEDEKLKEDQTANRIVVAYNKITRESSLTTAAEALADKQTKLEKNQDITAWSIDDEETRVIDGAQVTLYQYSFVKEIDNVKRAYEYRSVYVFTPSMRYESDVIGDGVSESGLVDTIEF